MNDIRDPQSGIRTPRTLVVIPARNESKDIENVISEVTKTTGFPVLVVDDASEDDTAECARAAGALVMPLAAQLGAWCATQAGLRYAQQKAFEFVISMDADGQHEPGALPGLMNPILENQADIVIGCCTKRGSKLRQVAWKLMKLVSGLSHQDLTSGFRVYDRRAIDALAVREATLLEFQDVGVLFLLQAQRLRISEVEVDMPPRTSGISRIFHSWSSVVYYMAYTLLLGATKRQRRARL